MKLKKEFITYETGSEQIMVATSSDVFSGLVRSNKTAAFIVDCLKEETTEDEIVQKMEEQYDAPEGVIRADVSRIIQQLRSVGAIIE